MSHVAFCRKITTQSVLAFILIIFGMALVMLALFMPPRGEIHPSVITVFGMLLVAAGAFLGIDLNFQFKSYLNSLQASAANGSGGHHRTNPTLSADDSGDSNPDNNENRLNYVSPGSMLKSPGIRETSTHSSPTAAASTISPPSTASSCSSRLSFCADM